MRRRKRGRVSLQRVEICGGREEEWSKRCRQKVYEARIQTLSISGGRERQRKERRVGEGKRKRGSEEGERVGEEKEDGERVRGGRKGDEGRERERNRSVTGIINSVSRKVS